MLDTTYITPSLSKAELAQHLAVDRSSVDRIASEAGLCQDYGRYPWRKVLRHIHMIDPSSLEALDVQYSLQFRAPDRRSLQDQLREPLLSFDQVARRLGYRPDTLSKAVRQKRIELPLSTLLLGPRLRRFRPLDLRIWMDFGVAIPYPVPATPSKATTELKPAVSTDLAHPPEAAVALVFGAFGKK